MAESEFFKTNQKNTVTQEEKCLPATEETRVRVLQTTRGAGRQEDESDSVMQPLCQHKHQDSRDENHNADTQSATNSPDGKTSVSSELGSSGIDRSGRSGSVRTLCSDSSGHECPICTEMLDSHGDHRATSLRCNHTLCRRCVDEIMAQARDNSRLQCPLCRQTTLFSQQGIRRQQEELDSNTTPEDAPSLIISPSPETSVPASHLFCDTGESHTPWGICYRCLRIIAIPLLILMFILLFFLLVFVIILFTAHGLLMYIAFY